MSEQNKSHDEVTEGLDPLYPRLWRYCLVLTGRPENADDLAQATCLKALEKSHQYSPDTQLDRWIFRIAQRTWLNERRAEAVRRGGGMTAIEDIDLPDNRPGPESNIFTRQVLLEVMALPEAQRTAIFLTYVEGYSYKESAKILSIPIGTLMSRLAAARAKVTKKFDLQKSKTG